MRKIIATAPLVLCVAWSVLYALSYLNIVTQPHGYEQASSWMYDHIERGSKILNVHWDDHLPIHLPGKSPQQYRFATEGAQTELPLYETDTPAKLSLITERLANADYLVFPTARLPGSIPRIPEEYPHSTAFFQLLFTEKLGYHLVKSFKARPTIGSWIFDDDLADESISVYDHPKATIFKNEAHLSAQELRSRILNPEQFGPLATREEILKMDVGEVMAPPGESILRSSVVQAIVWYIVVQLISFVCLPWIASLCSSLPDRGYGYTKVVGLLAIGYVSWLLQTLGITTGSVAAAWFVFALMLVSALIVLRAYRTGFVRLFYQNQYHIRCVELLFGGAYLSWMLIRSFQPEIFWGEKPMDFSFLNFFVRTRSLPPEDPWAAGHHMHYYYLGTYFMALLHKLSGVSTAVGYNLAIATLAAVCVCAAYSLLLQATRRVWLSLLGACAVVFLSNLEWIRLVLEGRKINFDLFWATTRLFTPHSITEYPIWSLLFADLHAHLIAGPFFMLLIGLLLFWISEDDAPTDGWRWIGIALLGITWGSLIALNSWDFISAAALIALAAVHRIFVAWTNRREGREFVAIVLELSAIGAIAILAALPFLLASGSSVRLGYGWVSEREFDTISQILRHLGAWLLPISFGMVLVLTHTRTWKTRFEIKVSLVAAACAGFLPLALGGASYLSGIKEIPWLIVLLGSVLCASAAFSAVLCNEEREVRCGALLLLGGALMMVFAELVFVMDRMNTIFKFYNAIWVLYGLSAVCFCEAIVERLWTLSVYDFSDKVLRFGSLIIPLGFMTAGAGSALNIYVMTSFSRTDGPRFTLNGQAYLGKDNKDEANMFSWIRDHIRGTPTMLEAQGPSYQDFTRVSMHTGLPTVLGWEYHVEQRGLDHRELQARKNAVRQVYTSPSVEEAYKLLKQYDVELLVIGELERKTYPAEGLAKFCERPDLFQAVFRSGQTILYKTDYSRRNILYSPASTTAGKQE